MSDQVPSLTRYNRFFFLIQLYTISVFNKHAPPYSSFFSYFQPVPAPIPYTLFPLGDSALLIDLGPVLDEERNKRVLQLFQQIKSKQLPYIKDVVPAYSSLAVYYDVPAVEKKDREKTAFETVAETICSLLEQEAPTVAESTSTISIPVCYALMYAPDLEAIAQQKNISVREVIQLHTSRTYRVYMIGFLPGFAYMGELDERIATPRKDTPLTAVPAGSVGIAGRQTGIYPLPSPGGWQLIGRTPLKLFDKVKEPPVLLQPGDRVQFYAITEDEFNHYQSRHS